MPIHKVQNRIIVFFLSLIALILLMSFFIVSVTFQNFIDAHSKKQLLTGQGFLEQILDIRSNDLLKAAQILADDTSFKAALQENTPHILQATLKNYADKVNADIAILLGLEADIKGSTLNPDTKLSQTAFTGLIENARQDGTRMAIIVFENTPYHFVLVPLLTPLPSGWLLMGYALDNAFLQRMSQLNQLEVSLFIGSNKPKAATSTLTHLKLVALEKNISFAELNQVESFHLENTDYIGTSFLLPNQPHPLIFANLQKSLELRKQLVKQLHWQLTLIFLFSIILGSLGTYFLAKGITEPIHSLIKAIKAIAKGEQAEEIQINDGDELSQLANEFNSMQTAIQQREKKIRHQAYYDQLTGLPNRAYFLEQLLSAIEGAKKNQHKVSILVMDLNRFKDINDTLGHKSGDLLLQVVTERLSSAFQEKAFIARLGADEFALMVKQSEPEALIEIANNIHKAINQPVNIQNMNLDVSASIGIAHYPEHGKEPANVLQRANIAMTAAKEEKTLYKFYDPDFDKHSVLRLSLMNELKTAVKDDDLVLYYQPKVDLKTNHIVSVESLVRWIHPKHGIISPTKFIPLAEQTGHIRYLTRWALHTAVKQAYEWQEAGLPIKVAVNISAVDLLDIKLVNEVRGFLKRFPVRPASIVLEITESAILGDLESALEILHDLRDLGILLSIDDFGTGYSSMSQLKNLPVQELKIDQSFIRNVLEDTNDQIIVRSTIELAHNMSLKVVGEGIDDERTLALLIKLDCDIAQGHYFSPPLSITDFSQWLIKSPYGLQSAP